MTTLFRQDNTTTNNSKTSEMAKTVIIEQFKKVDVADTSDILLPKDLYSTYWENSNDSEFHTKDGELEYGANDRCKRSYKLTLTIEP